jgi:uncharacterized protein (DUF1015 family)
VDSSEYGPQVHAIHRVVTGLSLADALARMPTGSSRAVAATELEAALIDAEQVDGFAAVLTDGRQAVLVTDPEGALTRAAARSGDLAALTELDVTIVHRGLIETMWNLPDTEDVVGYAHSVEDAVEAAHANEGFAILLRPTPVAAVAAVAAAGARMPRKSTLFTPKPASGLVMRRLVDQPADRPAAGS